MSRRKNSSKRKSKDDSFDEELAKEVYKRRKSFERPENKGLETIFETENNEKSRGNRATKGKLQPKLRIITTQPFFIEDQEKSTLRKNQTKKLFKGRKKPKWKGLSAKQEEKLLNVIANKSDTEEESEIEENFENNQMPFIVNSDSKFSLRLSETSEEEEKSFHNPKTSTLEDLEFASNVPEEKNEVDFDENVREADEFLGPLGFSDDEEENPVNAFKPMKVDNADKENVTVKSDRRKSKITKVRRSSRLFRGQNPPLRDQTNNFGSVFQEVEIIEEKKKNGRKSRLFVQPNMAKNNSPAMPGEETLSLFKNDQTIIIDSSREED